MLMQAMIDDLSGFSVEEINAAFKQWRQKHSKIPTPANILSYLKIGQIQESGGLMKFSSWQGDWQSYLAYLDENNALSRNFVQVGGYYKLRPGYTPPWEMKDFK